MFGALRWNNLLAQAKHEFCMCVCDYELSTRSEEPALQEQMLTALDDAYAFYVSTEAFLEHYRKKEPFVRYSDAVSKLKTRSLLYLVSGLHMSYAALMRGNEEGEGVFLLRAKCNIALFGRPESYIDAWQHRLEFVYEDSESKAVASRLSHSLYDDISPILGLPKNNIEHVLYWFQMLSWIAEEAGALFRRPDWRSEVMSDLCRHV